jgi:hypothetical protein
MLSTVTNRLLSMKKHHGTAFVIKYLKACSVALQRYAGGVPLKTLRELEPSLPLPRLTQNGLPSIIPKRDRILLARGSRSIYQF